MRVIVVLALLCGSSSVVKAQDVPNYWPLEVGNRWVYQYVEEEVLDLDNNTKVLVDEIVVLEVLGVTEIEGRHYFELSQGQLLRRTQEGNVAEYIQPQGIDEILFDFTHLADREYQFFLPYSAFPPARSGGGITGYPVARYSLAGWGSLIRVVPAGAFESVQFAFGDLSRATNIYFAEDVGVIYSESSGHMIGQIFEHYSLAEYRIAGNTFPTSVNHTSWANIKRAQ
jgi:hypothetical protein